MSSSWSGRGPAALAGARSGVDAGPWRPGAARAFGLLLILGLGGCATGGGSSAPTTSLFPESKWGQASRRVVSSDAPIPKGGGQYKIGSPYQVAGQWFVPREQPGYDRIGIASWYGADFHGRRTSNGEIYDMRALTAAHPTLPMPSYAYVTNPSNGRTILVRINDRGPYVANRVIDLSQASARLLGVERGGTGRVRVRYAGPAPLDGNDWRERQFLASRTWRSGQPVASAAPVAPRIQPPRAYVEPVMAVGSLPGPAYASADGRAYSSGLGASGPFAPAYSGAYSGDAWSPTRYRAGIAAR